MARANSKMKSRSNLGSSKGNLRARSNQNLRRAKSSGGKGG